jgi:chromosome segregation ATPase
MSFISKISEKTRCVFLLFVGPLFFLLSVGILYLNHLTPTYDLWVVFVLAIASIGLFHKKGLLFSLALAILFAGIHHDHFSQGPIWMSFWSLCLCTSLWMTFVGQNELEKKLESFHLEQMKMKDNFSIYEQELQKEVEEHKNQFLALEESISKKEEENYQINQKYQSAQTLVDILRKEEMQNFDERQSLINECIELRRKLALSEEKNRLNESENKNLAQEQTSSQLKEEIAQITHAYEELQEELRQIKESPVGLSKEVKSDSKKLDAEIKKYQGLYLQLQRQFEEQKIYIHEARKELFYAQEKIALLEKDKEMNEIDLNEKDKTIEKMLIDYMAAYQNHEEEIENLEKIITVLNQKSKKLNSGIASN